MPPPLLLQIHKLQAENTQIRQQTGPVHPTPAPSERPEHGHPPGTAPSHRRDRQAFSMYEPGSALKPFGQPVEELVTRLQPFGAGVSVLGRVGGFWGAALPPAPQGAGSLPHGAVTFRVSPGGGGRGSVLHAHPGQRVPGKGAAAGAAPAWDVVAVTLLGCGLRAVLGRPVPPPPCTLRVRPGTSPGDGGRGTFLHAGRWCPLCSSSPARHQVQLRTLLHPVHLRLPLSSPSRCGKVRLLPRCPFPHPPRCSPARPTVPGTW